MAGIVLRKFNLSNTIKQVYQYVCKNEVASKNPQFNPKFGFQKTSCANFSYERIIAKPTRHRQQLILCRFFSNEAKQDRHYPNLMTVPMYVWPNFILTIKNLVFTHAIIKPYFDVEFGMKNFLTGSKQALVYVSSQLASGNFVALKELITEEALEKIQVNLGQFNLQEKEKLIIKKGDIFFSYIYQIGIMFDSEDSKKRFAEITAVFHCLDGYNEMMIKGFKDDVMKEVMKRNVTVCNYRFIREYTKGVQSEWKINQLNHFRNIEVT